MSTSISNTIRVSKSDERHQRRDSVNAEHNLTSSLTMNNLSFLTNGTTISTVEFDAAKPIIMTASNLVKCEGVGTAPELDVEDNSKCWEVGQLDDGDHQSKMTVVASVAAEDERESPSRNRDIHTKQSACYQTQSQSRIHDIHNKSSACSQTVSTSTSKCRLSDSDEFEFDFDYDSGEESNATNYHQTSPDEESASDSKCHRTPSDESSNASRIHHTPQNAEESNAISSMHKIRKFEREQTLDDDNEMMIIRNLNGNSNNNNDKGINADEGDDTLFDEVDNFYASSAATMSTLTMSSSSGGDEAVQDLQRGEEGYVRGAECGDSPSLRQTRSEARLDILYIHLNLILF